MKSKNSLQLYFGNKYSPGLYRTVFRHYTMEEAIVGMRGTTIPTSGMPFIWGPSSQAMALLFVTAVKAYVEKLALNLPLLEGASSSPAGTLARLLKKRSSSWLLDLFGSDASGRSFLHRMIILGNPRGRQHGPISATLRSDFLSPAEIQIFVDGEDVTSQPEALSSLRESLEKSFIPRKDPLAGRKLARLRHPETKKAPKYVLTTVGEAE